MQANFTVNHVPLHFFHGVSKQLCLKLICKIKSELNWNVMLDEGDEKGICFLNMKEFDFKVSRSMRKKSGV